MASITCYAQKNYGGASRTYTSDEEDITANGAVMSCKVSTSTVTVFQNTKYEGASAQLAVGSYSDPSNFPAGVIKSLKVN